jgi:hypothetical protein
MEPKNRFQGTNSARLCSLAGQYDNTISTQFLAPIDYLKIPVLVFLMSFSDLFLEKGLGHEKDIFHEGL